jgi:thiol-disulfide isomerase/thioredoxin
MKKLFLITAIAGILIVAGCSRKGNDPSTIMVTLENSTIEKIELNILKDFINFSRETISATADENGVFTLEATVPYAQIVYLTIDRRRVSLWLGNGGTLEVKANMEDWDNSLAFSGDFAYENTFLVQNTRALAPVFGQNQMMDLYRSGTADEFARFSDDRYTASIQLFDEHNNTAKFSNDFSHYFLTQSKYAKYLNLINFKPYAEHFNNVNQEIPDGFYDFVPEALKYNDNDMRIATVGDFLNLYVRHTATGKEFPEDLDIFEKQIFTAKEVLSGKAHEYVLTGLINAEFNWGKFSRAEQHYLEFAETANTAEFKEILLGSYEAAKRVAPGNAAPSFTLTDINGNEVALSDFNGKVVYLDFWASWCGPCMREVPFAKELKKKFEGQDDLVFLYISVDEDPQAWRNKVEEQQIQGVHLNISGMSSEISRSYNVKGVPSFFIIDREGKIHDNNPGRPSSGSKIEEQLRAALEL